MDNRNMANGIADPALLQDLHRRLRATSRGTASSPGIAPVRVMAISSMSCPPMAPRSAPCETDVAVTSVGVEDRRATGMDEFIAMSRPGLAAEGPYLIELVC